MTTFRYLIAGSIIPQIQQTEANVGERLKNRMWACDSGYHESENIKFLSDTAIDGYMPDNNSRKARNPYDKKNFVYDHAQDQYLCPAGQPVIFVGEHLDRQKNKMIRHY